MKATACFAALLILVGHVVAETPAAPKINSAIVPEGRLEKDFYDWNQRHAAIQAIKDKVNPELVFLGDSITHLWAGEPNEPKGNRGADSMKDLCAGRSMLNLGFGWDRTQNVLYRLEHGELDGLKPKAVVLLIGTNNLAVTKQARENTPAEIAEAIALIVTRVQAKCPGVKVVLMGVFPRGEKPKDPKRAKIAEINKLIAKLGEKPGVTYLDITAKLTNPDGSISKDVMGDYLHPTAKGYAIWAEALKPVLAKP